MGATLRILNSTITAKPGFFVWNFAGTTRRFGRVEEIPFRRGSYSPPHVAYAGFQSIFIEKSTISNCAYFFVDEPIDFVIKDVKFTNLHSIDWGRYNLTDSNDIPRRNYARGAKSWGILIKDIGHVWRFEVENVIISGTDKPATFFYMVNCDWCKNKKQARYNLYNVKFHNAQIKIKKSARYAARYEPGFPVYGEEYYSRLELVNSTWDNPPIIQTDKASFIPKYYLDVKVVRKDGKPVSGAVVKVNNEIDPAYPPENMASRVGFYDFQTTARTRVHCHFPSAVIYENGLPIISTLTGPDGHTPLPKDKKNTIILTDFVQDKNGKKEFTYTITVEKDGKRKVIKGVNPGPEWYRPDPNKPTYTVVVVLDE